MIRVFLVVGITAFWVTMMSQLIQREYFEVSTDSISYEVIPITTTPIIEDYRAIYLGRQRIGFDYHGFERVKDKPGYEYNHYDYELRHTSYMSFLLLGHRNEMFIKGTAWMDSQFQLQEFRVQLQTADYKTKIEGKVQGGKIQALLQENETEPVKHSIEGQGNVVYSEALENIWTESNLRVGKKGRFQIFNPLLLSTEDLEFRVERKEEIKHGDKKLPAYLVLLGDGLSQTRSWISEEGRTLRKETPSGLTLISEPGWEIFDAMREGLESLPDLPNLYSIESDQEIKDPEKVSRLKLRLITQGTPQIVTLEKENFEGLEKVHIKNLKFSETEEFLKSSQYLQSDDPNIQKKAEEILQGEILALPAAIKIMNWVHHYVAPQPTLSIPSANQILATKKGDCNEFTALFAALSRAAGIPAKTVAGIVYQDGRFFYHAWPAVYVGRWVSMDPTFGQAPVDVTHIPLVLGDLPEQVRLAEKIGQIQVEVLEYQ